MGLITKNQNLHYDMLTHAGERKNPEAWVKYPRPQMKRDGYMILNRGWTLNGKPIKVPFSPQAYLSEYKDKVGTELVYETAFVVPESFVRERILLHFGAVDQLAEVWLNDICVGRHAGGYTSFTLDITEGVRRQQENKLIVKVTDELSKDYPYGKQCKRRGGMWYTPISGIWQTVWLENVPKEDIKNIILKPDLNGIHIQLETETEGFKAIISLHNGEVLEQSIDGREGYINMTEYVCANGDRYEPKLWSTDAPYLYSMKIISAYDEIETYFALRVVEIRSVNEKKCLCLNGNPIFLHGVLDQGYFSDGIYLPAEEEEYERDIMRMKELGFNTLRKHIKVEPDLFYYYCDKHGMLIMQDMVNSGGYSFLFDTALPTIGLKKRKDRVFGQRRRKQIFKDQMAQTVRQLYNHPCIVAYTIFNEGWGQFDSDDMYDYLKQLDDSRVIDSTSGWFWQKKSDFDSVHIYFRMVQLQVKSRPLLLSECGGFTRTIEGHLFNTEKSYGYGKAESEEALTKMIIDMYEEMILPVIRHGMCGCIYTQLSDVEDEVNGLYTYDRRICKVNKEKMRQLSDKLLLELLKL